MTKVLSRGCLWGILVASLTPFCALAGDDAGPGSIPPGGGQFTGFSNMGSIGNTRHNMTQSTLTDTAGGQGAMNNRRNNYFQVCVYCHTPHGANANTAAPLWNRLVGLAGTATYTVYSSSSMNGVANQPGAASLPCLSCHDGTQAVDAILNMPGSGKYSETPTETVLDNWQTTGTAATTGRSAGHYTLAAFGSSTSCLSCHSPTGDSLSVDFTAFSIGTDLRNDHPVGVPFPTANGAGTDWKTPGGSKVSGGVTITYFDEPGAGSGRLDKGDIRLYGAASDARVECASCHDPHGVPTGAAGTVFQPTFLRKTIDGSGVCLTCHAK